jgi:hypothetical protein
MEGFARGDPAAVPKIPFIGGKRFGRIGGQNLISPLDLGPATGFQDPAQPGAGNIDA